MFTYEDKIEIITKLINQCFVPQLQKDIGITFIDSNDFQAFQQNLNICLPQLFDLINKNDYLLYETDKNTLEVKE